MTALPSPGELYHCLNGDQIRVLTIDASSSVNDKIACTLSPVSLAENPVYNALSYVWGDAQDAEIIVVNGHEIKVTKNLMAILRHFRAYTGDLDVVRTTPLWIDAVCINQADMREREQQVRRMRDIYRHAARVLSWIGVPDALSDWAFDRMNDPAFMVSLRALETTGRVPTPSESRLNDIILRNIERRVYWTRLWVLQEVALSREGPLLLCGTRCLPLDIYRSSRVSLETGIYDAQVYDGTEGASGEAEVPWHGDARVDAPAGSWLHTWLRTNYEKQNGVIINQALLYAAATFASDPRDYVYGILGLLQPADMARFSIDYSQSPMDVYKDAMRLFWTSGQNRAMGICAVQLSFSRAGFDAAPSWVVDLSRQHKYRSLVAGMSMDNWNTNFSADAGFDGDVLVFSGIEFDSVEGIVLTDMRLRWAAPDLNDEELAALKKIEELVTKSRAISPTDDEDTAVFHALRAAEPLWRTLTRTEDRSRLLPRALDSETRVLDYEQKLWDILMRREAIPQAWGVAYPTAIREDAAALRAEVLVNMLRGLHISCDETRILLTRRGFLGVSTLDVAVGDVVVLIPGMVIPFVLRPWQDGYRIVGFAYVAGLTDLDALNEALGRSGLRKKVFRVY